MGEGGWEGDDLVLGQSLLPGVFALLNFRGYWSGSCQAPGISHRNRSRETPGEGGHDGRGEALQRWVGKGAQDAQRGSLEGWSGSWGWRVSDPPAPRGAVEFSCQPDLARSSRCNCSHSYFIFSLSLELVAGLFISITFPLLKWDAVMITYANEQEGDTARMTPWVGGRVKRNI